MNQQEIMRLLPHRDNMLLVEPGRGLPAGGRRATTHPL